MKQATYSRAHTVIKDKKVPHFWPYNISKKINHILLLVRSINQSVNFLQMSDGVVFCVTIVVYLCDIPYSKTVSRENVLLLALRNIINSYLISLALSNGHVIDESEEFVKM